MKTSWTKLSDDDAVVVRPGVFAVENQPAENRVEIKPTGIRMARGSGKSIDLNFTDGLKIVWGAKSIQLSPDVGLAIKDGDKTIDLNFTDGLKIVFPTKSIQLSPEVGLVIKEGMKTTTLSILQLFHDDGEGKTNSVTEEQMVIHADSNTAVYEATGLTLTSASNTVTLDVDDVLQATIDSGTLSATPSGVELSDGGEHSVLLSPTAGLRVESDTKITTLDADKLRIEEDADFAEVSPAGGLEVEESSYKAKISPSAGVHLEDTGGGIVDIAAIPEKTINLRDTQMCEEVAGVPTQKHAHVLRGESETV